MSQDLYKEKYVKYKSKYLSLKNVDGAGIFEKMLPGRYFFYVPPSVFNMIAAYIFLNQLTKNISSKGKTSASVVPVQSAPVVTEQSTPVVPVQSATEVPVQQEIYIEGLPSDVLFNIINKDNQPSYRISPGDKTYINLKDDKTFNAFDDAAKKFGYKLETEPISKMQKAKAFMSDQSTQESIKNDVSEFKKKINLPTYKLIHYEVKKVGSNIIYATEYSTTEKTEHPITSHLIKMKEAIQSVVV
jgi:hypothetical protein